jgi:D-serine deaminase-like pyridoxal phosphate-dependent protein
MADVIRKEGVPVDIVSIGATPSMMQAELLAGITEIRPGTYVFMDVGQGSALGNFEKCAATVLTTVISKPNQERIVIDAGAKALTTQNRSNGICATYGYGLVKHSANVRLDGMFDEHGVINNEELSEELAIGDKIEIIPNHICPCCNLYEQAYLVSNNQILRKLNILGRGKTQ